MFETPFYHGTLKQLVIGVGTLFGNIQIPRADTNGVVSQYVKVPLAYAPKEKWQIRADQDPNLTDHVFSTMPRMSFELTNYAYDSTRMVTRNQKIKSYLTGIMNTVYTPVPYNVDISLYAQTKGTEDGLAIIEQILPLFTPEYNLNLMVLPEMGVMQNIPIILNSVSVQDDYEGDFTQKRIVTHTFSFQAKINLFGVVREDKQITSVKAKVDTQTISTGETVFDADGDPITRIKSPGVWTP